MHIYPHLCFDGQCEAAFRFYGQVFGGELTTMLSYGDSPMARQVAPEWRGKIIHATLSFEGGQLFGADVLPGTYKPPQGFFVLVSLSTAEKAKAVFDALSNGGVVQAPFHETFWSAGFCMLVDRFGIPWELTRE